MKVMSSSDTLPGQPENRLGGVLLWLLLAVAIMKFPHPPAVELDASWRMALGWFFDEGMQFGRDVVFTYGPLGFLMGRTYGGFNFWTLVLGQLLQALAFSAIIVAHARQLRPVPRFFYFAFFLFLGVIYEDALHMIIIAMLGWDLVRREEPTGGGYRWRAALLALLGVVKFTNLLLALFVVLAACAEAAWRHRTRAALAPLAWFVGAFLLFWILCGQNPLNLPLYAYRSLQVSSGYQAAMGIPTPAEPFWKAIVVLALLVSYSVLYLLAYPRRSQAVASVAILAAFVYLNWKHGFVRADGHMIGFFICALVPCAAFPALLGDGPRFHRIQRGLLVAAAGLSVVGVRDALPGVIDGFAGHTHGTILRHVTNLSHLPAVRRDYDEQLRNKRIEHDLPRTRETVGGDPIDVLGFEQAVALVNRLNYRPRPVFQSYTAYTPYLARVNGRFYMSEEAPRYALLKIQTIDERLPTMDDSRVLLLFPHLYEFVHTEKGYQLWRRRDAPANPADLAPRRLRTVVQPLNEPLDLGRLSRDHLWVEIDLQPSLLGRLRSLLYKPPFIRLAIEDSAGARRVFRMPGPIGRGGFILNPLVTDLLSYMHFSGGKPDRWAESITVEVEPGAGRYFRRAATVGLFSINPAVAGAEYLQEMERVHYSMFKHPPIESESFSPPSTTEVDDRPVIVMHAPSRMEFLVPEGATEASGTFGFLPGAYRDGGDTDGALFKVVWTNGSDEVPLYERLLDPKNRAEDQGLHEFRADLSGVHEGRLRLSIEPGPHGNHSFDWTVWTGIEIKQ